VSERPQGMFSHQIFLGEGLDLEAIEASYEHGVLSIQVPVLETAKPRKVPFTVGEEQQAIETSAS
jgi:HSP20 family protein